MTPRIAAFLKKSGVIPEVNPSTRIDAIKMNTTTFQGGSLVSLLFLDGSESPSYVLRIPRDRARPERVLANYRALQELKTITAVADVVPKPVYQGEVFGTALTVETCLHGTSLYAELSVRGQRSALVLDQLFDWLWRLHESTTCPSPAAAADSASSDLELLRESRLVSSESAAYLKEWTSHAVESGLYCAFRHGDFNPNNILIAEDGTPGGVVDWEYSGPGPAVFDVFSMLRTGLLIAESEAGGIGDQVDALFNGAHIESPRLLRALERYSAADNHRALFIVYLVQMLAEFVRTTGNRRDPQLRPWLDYLNGLPSRRPTPPRGTPGLVTVC